MILTLQTGFALELSKLEKDLGMEGKIQKKFCEFTLDGKYIRGICILYMNKEIKPIIHECLGYTCEIPDDRTQHIKYYDSNVCEKNTPALALEKYYNGSLEVEKCR